MKVGLVSSWTKAEGHRNGPAFIEQVVKGIQPDLKQAQIAAALPVEDLVPTSLHSLLSQVDDPDVGQTGCDHEMREPVGIRYVALMEVESPTFLI